MHSYDGNNRTTTLRVIVADDCEGTRRAIEQLLADSCTVIRAVSNGRELVGAAIAERPDVIVSDVNMPGITGIGAMQLLQDGGHRFPFVLVSAAPRDVSAWIELGARCVVDKIDMATDLVEAIEAAARGEVYISRHALEE